MRTTARRFGHDGWRRLPLLVLAAVAGMHAASAQEALRDYQLVLQADPWFGSPNAAALTRFDTASIAQAELTTSWSRGGLAPYYEAPRVLQAGASVQSLFRISPRAVVFGSMSYDNFSGSDMAGSAFISTGHTPFDIVEDSLGNEGDVHRDTYRLSGGVGISVGGGLSVGARMDYTAANLAKYKDLRHKNKLMDMCLTAGLYAPLGRVVSVGAHYQYRRTTESVTFGVYGREEKVYKSLISYGAFFGQAEQFGNTGYTDKSREMPLVDDYNGVGVQASACLGGGLLAYADAAYSHRRGYYGRKSPFTITYTGHHSDSYQVGMGLRLQAGTARHCLDAALEIENLQNEANVYRELVNESGASYYEYYTPVKTANKLWTDGWLTYTLHLGQCSGLPVWTLQAGYSYARRQQTAYVFPYYRRQDLCRREGFASAERRMAGARGMWTVALGGSFGQGTGLPYEDLTFQQSANGQAAPATMEAWLQRDYQWTTAPQYGVNGSVKYVFVWPGTQLCTHVKATVAHRKANSTNDYCLGRDRTQVGLTLGCTF